MTVVETVPQPGDLIYIVNPDTREVFVDQMWTVVENEGAVPDDRLHEALRGKTFWSVQVSCDGTCRTSNCEGPGTIDWFLLSADDFVRVADANLEVRR